MTREPDPLDPCPIAPAWATGLWKRHFIRFADGTTDSRTEVYWGQTFSLFVDLRVPADRPLANGRESFDAFTTDELIALADQKGFAGHIELKGNDCQWIRYIDYRPATGRPDKGRLRVAGDELWEEGGADTVIGAAYQELYHRVARADAVAIALRQAAPLGSTPDAIIIVIGDLFMFARSRQQPLPHAESLRDLAISARSSRALLHAYLDCEIAWGKVSGAIPWTIERSTLPFREGHQLATAEFRPAAHAPDLLIGGPAVESTWRIISSTLPQDRMIKLLNHQ
jgi:hypothetical protein